MQLTIAGLDILVLFRILALDNIIHNCVGNAIIENDYWQ